MIPSSDRTRGYSIHITQNIGIVSNTYSQGELSYRASSLHVAFMTAQKMTLTIPWCSQTTGKENLPHKDCVQTMPWRQQDSRCTGSEGVHNYAWEICPPASLLIGKVQERLDYLRDAVNGSAIPNFGKKKNKSADCSRGI